MPTDAPEPEKSFRLFVTNGRGRIDTAAQEIRARSDAEAIATASELVGDATFEIWEGGRRVVTAGRGERDADRAHD